MEPEDNPLPRRPAPRQPRLLPRAGRVPSWARGRSPMRTGRGHRRIPVPRRPGPGGCGPEGFWAVQEGGVASGRGSSPVPGAYGYHNGGPSDWKGPLAEEGPSPAPSVGQRRAQGPVRGHSVPDPYHGAEAGEGWEEVALPPVSTSYSLPELPNLSEEERQCIMEVIRRDEHLRRQDDLRVMRLKAELQFLRRKGALRADWDPNSSGGGGGGSGQAVGGSPSSVISSAGIGLVGGLGSGLIGGGGGNGGGRACARCRAELGRIINRGAFCRACRLRVCKACREYNVRATDWVCSVCHKHMEIQVATGEWMNEFVRRPSRRRDNRVYVPAADIVKRSIRRSWTISTSHRRSFGGPQGSPELRAYSSLPRGASYLPAAAAEAAADAADAVAADTARRSADNRESPPHRRLPAHPLLYLLRRGSSSGSGSIGAGGSGDRHMDAVPTRRCVSQDEDVMPPMPMPLSRRDDGDSIFSSDKKFQSDSPGGSRRGIGRKGVSLRRQHAVSTGSAGSAGEVSSEGECFVPKSPRERKGSGGGGSGGGVDRFARALEKANSSRSSNDSSIQKVGRGESLERRSSKEKDASSSSDKEVRQRPHQQKQQQQQQQQQKQRQQHHQRQPTEEEEEDDDEEEDPVEDFDVEPLSGTIFRKVTIKRKKKKKSVEDEEAVAEGDDSGGGIGAGDAGQTTPSSASSTVAPSPSLVRSEKSLLHHHHAGELSRRLGAAAFTHDGTAPPYEAGGGSPAHAALLLDYVLDEGKIHPDGEDYKLVFISSDSSSKASTINSDEEEVPAEDCDWDYFEPARAVIVREMGDGGQSVVDPEEHVVVGGGGGGSLVRQLQHLSRSPLAASSPAASGASPRSSLLPPGRKPLLPPDQHHLLTTPSTSPSPPPPTTTSYSSSSSAPSSPTPPPPPPPPASEEVSKLPPATQSGTAGQAVAAKTPHHHVFRHHKQQRRFLQPKGVVETAATEGGEPGEVVSLADHIFFVEPMPAAVVADRQGSSLEGPPQTTPSQPPPAPTPQSSSSAVAARRARRRRARRVGRSRSETDLARLHLRLAPPPGEARLPGERSGSEGFVIDQGSSATTTILTASGGAGIRMWTLEREGGDQGRTIIPVPVPVPVPAWPHQQQHPQVFTLHDRADEIEIDLQGPAQGSSRAGGDGVSVADIVYLGPAGSNAVRIRIRSFQRSSQDEQAQVGAATPAPSSWYAWHHRVFDQQAMYSSSVTLSPPNPTAAPAATPQYPPPGMGAADAAHSLSFVTNSVTQDGLVSSDHQGSLNEPGQSVFVHENDTARGGEKFDEVLRAGREISGLGVDDTTSVNFYKQRSSVVECQKVDENGKVVDSECTESAVGEKLVPVGNQVQSKNNYDNNVQLKMVIETDEDGSDAPAAFLLASGSEDEKTGPTKGKISSEINSMRENDTKSGERIIEEPSEERISRAGGSEEILPINSSKATAGIDLSPSEDTLDVSSSPSPAAGADGSKAAVGELLISPQESTECESVTVGGGRMGVVEGKVGVERGWVTEANGPVRGEGVGEEGKKQMLGVDRSEQENSAEEVKEDEAKSKPDELTTFDTQGENGVSADGIHSSGDVKNSPETEMVGKENENGDDEAECLGQNLENFVNNVEGERDNDSMEKVANIREETSTLPVDASEDRQSCEHIIVQPNSQVDGREEGDTVMKSEETVDDHKDESEAGFHSQETNETVTKCDLNVPSQKTMEGQESEKPDSKKTVMACNLNIPTKKTMEEHEKEKTDHKNTVMECNLNITTVIENEGEDNDKTDDKKKWMKYNSNIVAGKTIEGEENDKPDSAQNLPRNSPVDELNANEADERLFSGEDNTTRAEKTLEDDDSGGSPEEDESAGDDGKVNSSERERKDGGGGVDEGGKKKSVGRGEGGRGGEEGEEEEGEGGSRRRRVKSGCEMGEGEEESSYEEEDVEEEENDVDEGEGKKQMSIAPRTAVKSSGGGEVVEKDVGVLEEDSAPSNAIRSVEEETEESVAEEPIRHAEESAEGSVAEEISEEEKGVGARHGGEGVTMKTVEGDRSGAEREGQESKGGEECEQENKFELRVGDEKSASAEVVQRTDEKTSSVEEMKIALEKDEELKMMEKDLVGKIHDETEDINVNDEKKIESSVSVDSHVECERMKISAEEDNVSKEVADENIDGIQDENIENEILREKSSVSKLSGSKTEEGKLLRVKNFKDEEEIEMEAVVPEESSDDGDKEEESKRPNEINLEANAVIVDSEATHTAEVDESEDKGIKRGEGKAVKHGKQSEDMAGPATLESQAVFAIEFSNNAAEEASSVGSQPNPEAIESRGDGSVDSEALEGQPVGENVVSEGGMVGNSEADDNSEDRSALEEKVEEEIISVESYQTATVVEGKDEPKSEEECVKQDDVVIEKKEDELVEEPSELRVEEFVNAQCMREMSENSSKLSDEPDACRDKKEISIVDAIIPSEEREIMEETKGRAIGDKKENIENSIDPLVKANEKSEETDEIPKSENIISTPEISEKIISKSDSKDILEVCEEKEIVEENVDRVNIGESVEKEDIKENVKTGSFEESLKTVIAEESLKGKPAEKIKKRGKFVKSAKTKNISCPSDFSMKAENEARNETSEGPSQISNNGIAESAASKETGERELSGFEIVTCSGEKSIPEKGTDTTVSAGQTALLSEEGSEEEEGGGHNSASVVLLSYRPLFEPSASGPTGESEACEGVHSGDRVGDDDPPNGPGASGGTLSTVGGVASEVPTSGDVEGGEEVVVKPPATHTTAASVAIPCTPPTAAATIPVEGKVFSLEEEERGEKEGKATLLASKKPPSVPCETRLEAVRVEEDHKGGLSIEVTTAGGKSRRRRRNRKRRRRRGGRQKEEEASAGVEEEDEEDHGEDESRTEEEAVVLPVEAEDLSPAMGDGRPDSVQQEGEAAAPGKVVVELAPGEGSGGEDSMAAQDSDEGETSSGEFDLASGPRWNSMMTPPSVSSNSDAAGNSEESDSDDENFSRVFVVNPVDDEEDEGVGRGEEDEDDDDEEEVKAEGGVKGADAGAKQVVVKLEGAVLPYGGAGVRLMHIRTLTDEDHVPSNVSKAKDPSAEVIQAPLTEQDEVRASSSTSPLVDSDYSDRERGDADGDEKLDGEQSAVEIFAEKLGDVSAASGDSLELCAENSLGEDEHSIPTLTKLSSILEPDPPIIYALRDDSRDTYRERSESIDKSNEAFDSSAEAEMADVGAGRHPPPLPQVAEEAAGAVHVISPASGGEAGGEAGESGDHAVAKAGGGGGGADPGGGGGVVAMETEGAALGAVEEEDDVPASAGETGKKKDVGSGDGEEERAADSSPAGGESGGGEPGESAPIGEDADGVSGDGGLEVGNGSGAAVAPGEEECISGPSVCDVSGGEGGGSLRAADCGGGDSVLVSALPVSIGSKRDPREGEEAGDKEDISVNDNAVIVEAVCESTVAERSALGAAAPSLSEDADAGDCVIKGDETQVDAPVTSELCEEISVMGDIDGENKEGKGEGEIEEDDTVDVFSESSPKGSESGDVVQKIRDSNMSEEPPPEVRTGGSDVSEGVVGSEDTEDGDNAVEGIARVDEKAKTGPAPGPVSLRSVFESKGEQKPEKEGESMEEEYRISPQLHAKATKAELVSSPHGSERGEDEIKGLGSGDEEIWGLESDIHSGERGIVVDEVEISPAEGAATPAPALTPREEQAGEDGSGSGSEMALAIAVGEGKEVEGGVGGEGPEVEFGGEEERIDPVPAVGLADRLTPTSDTTPAPAPSSSSPLPPVSPQTRRRSSLPPPPPPTPSPPGENAPEGGRGSVDAWRAPSEDDGVFHRGSGFRWRTVGGRTAGEGRCVSLEDILHPEARSPTFAASGLGSTSESAITTTTTTGGGGVYTSYVMITQDGGEGLSAGDSEGLSHELEESEDGEGAAEEGGEERLQRVNVSVVEVSVVTSETTTLVSEEEEDRDGVDAEDDDEEEDEVSSDEGGVVLKHANWEEEEDNNKSNRGLAGYFTLTLETGTASPTPPRRPEVMSRKTIQLKDPSGMGNGVVDLPIGGGDMSGGDSSVDSDDGRKGERDAVRVVTGGDTLSAVVCLEEGLADDDSWVEEVDATIDDIRDEDDDDELGSESASSGDEAYFDREEELRGYNRAIDFTLHTILEESGEESEAESHLAASQFKNQAVSQGGNKKQTASNAEADASELEKYYFFDLGGMKGGNQQEGEADDQKFANEESEISDTVSETSCSSIYSEGLESMGMLGAGAHDGLSETADSILGMDPAELASSRLEKYFMTNILGLEPPRGLRAPLGDEDAFSENTDESGSVGSDSEGRPSPEQRRKRLVRARGAGRQHHNSGGSGGGAASDAEAATGSPSGTTSEGAYSQQSTHTHSQAHHHQQQQKLLGQQQNQQQQLNGSQQDLGDLEGSSSGSDSFDETAFEKNDGQFDTVKRKKKKRKDNRHSEGETKEESIALSGEDHEGAKTPQPDLATVAEEEEDGGEDRVGGGERERDDEVRVLEAENSVGPGGQAGRKQASRDSGFIGSCDDLLKDQQQQRASDGEQRSSGSDKDTKNSGQKDSGGVEERVASAASARKGEVETQVPKEGDVKPSLDVIGEAEVAPLPTPRPVPSGSPASITRTSLSRKDSFNNWSSDEETNLMMSKMRAFFKTMVAGKMAAAHSSGLRRSLSNSSRQSNGADAHSASSSTNGDVAEPTEKVKPPQLVYFENELTRLMKTVPGIRDEQVREIVEYLSSEDTWSDSYDSSDYTSSDVEVAGMGYHGRGPSGPLRSELQQQISASCQQIIKNFDNCAVEDVEEEESFTRSKTTANPTSDAMNRETAFVYQRLVASFGKVAGGVGEPSSSDASSTPHSSPPLIAKVMHHIGGRLVALMHEVSAAGSGEGPHASTSSSPNFTRNLPGGAGSPKSGNNQAAAAMAARYRRLLRREAAAAAKDDKGSVTSTSVESECPSTDTEERSVDSDADSSSSSPPPLPRLPSLPRSKSHDLGQWQRLLLTGEGNRRASEAHYYYSGIGSSGGASGVSGVMGPSGVHHAGGRDNKESLRSSSSGVSDLAEEREEYERLSWKGSFESALAADSRTKLSMEAKRRSAGSGSGSASDLCSSSDQLDHRGRVRSCGSITSAGSRGSLLQQQQQLGARARLSGSGGDLLAYRSSASRGGTVAEEHEGEGDDEGDGDAAGSTGALARRRRSVPDARGPPGERSTTLPRSNTAVSASTNSLPRLPTGSAPPHGTAAAAIHKSQSLMGHHMQQAHQQQQSHHHHHHLFLQNVKSARYRPPGFRPPPVPPVPPKRAVSVPGLNHQSRGRGERRRQSSGGEFFHFFPFRFSLQYLFSVI